MPFNVTVVANADGSYSCAGSGTESHEITWDERNTFNLQDSVPVQPNWLICLTAAALGSCPPNGTWLTRSGDQGLHDQNNCPPVTVKTLIKSVSIDTNTVTPFIAASAHYENKSDPKATTAVMDVTKTLSYSFTDTISRSHTESNEIAVGQEVSYGISFLGEGVQGKTSLSYTHNWSDTNTSETTSSITVSDEVTMHLPPGEEGYAVLSMNKGVLKVNVVYESTLSGMVMAKFDHGWNNNIIYGVDVNSVLTKNGLPTTITNTYQLVLTSNYGSQVSSYQGPKPQVPPGQLPPSATLLTAKAFKSVKPTAALAAVAAGGTGAHLPTLAWKALTPKAPAKAPATTPSNAANASNASAKPVANK